MGGLPERFGDRFVVERELGRGGWGTVYAVRDTEQGTRVALKHLNKLNPDSLIRFKREFRAVAELDDPNLVRLYELFGDADVGWYYTMERIDGRHLTSALGVVHTSLSTFSLTDSNALIEESSASPSRDWDRVRTLFVQLAHALRAIHQAGLLHRDLKPSNVMVAGDRVVLLDFGIAGDATSGDIASLGTPAYMAPEQGSEAERAGPAADWYAMGVMLFQVLTGRLPFTGESTTVLAAKRSVDGPDPRELNALAPADLADLCGELIRSDPEARPSGSEVVRRLGSAPVAMLPPTRFVGRDAELKRLEHLVARRYHGLCLIRGPSGLGKTALATAFLRRIRAKHPGAMVLAGRSRKQEFVPFKALDGVFDGMVVALSALDPADARSLIPGGARALGELFPVLLQVPAFAERAEREAPEEAPQARRRMAIAALRMLLHRMGKRGPVIWLLDDLHWGDLDSAGLLGALWAPPDPPPLMVIGTARPEPSECLDRLAEGATQGEAYSDTIELLPLGRTASLELLGKLGEERPDLIRLADQAAGHPWLLDAVVRYAAEGGETARIDLDQVLERRISDLSPAALDVLALCAVAGRPVDRRLARAAADMGPRFDEALHALEVTRLVRFRRDGETGGMECYHDRIRESVLATLSEERRRGLHADLAQAMSSTPEELLVHLLEAGLEAEAADVAERAAEQARSAMAFVLAAEHYDTAARCLGDSDPARVLDLKTRRAEAFADAGRMVHAGQAYLEAADCTEDGVALRANAALQLLNAGRLVEGLATARGVCGQLGLAPPADQRWSIAQVLWGRATLWWRGLEFTERAVEACDPRDVLRHDTLSMLADGLSVVDTTRAAALRQRSLAAALALGEPKRVAMGLCGLAQSTGLPGGASEADAQAILDKARPLVQRLDDAALRAYVAVSAGAIAYLAGKPVEAGHLMKQALELHSDHRTGSLYALNQARVFQVYGACYAGDLRQASDLVDAYREVALDSGNIYLGTYLATARANLLLPARDDPDRGYRIMERAIEDWSHLGYHIQHWWAMKARCDLDLYCGEPERCIERLELDWPFLESSLLHRVEAARLTNLFLRARSLAAVAMRGRHGALALARRDLAAIERTGSGLTPPYAAHVRAAIAQVDGRYEDRDRELGRALELYDGTGLHLFRDMGRVVARRLAGQPAPLTALEARKIRSPDRMIQMFYPALGPASAPR